MTHHHPSRSRRSHARRQRREGAALLVVLFILMMSTATAVFAMQSTQFEQRAAGSLQQAVRTKYVAEAATVGVLGFCLELGSTGCADMKQSLDQFSSKRAKYGLPNWGAQETIIELSPDDLVGSTWTTALLPSDSTISDAVGQSGAASPYTPSFVTQMEKWKLPNMPGETRPRSRMVVSTYGLMSVNSASATDATGTNEARAMHETVSATRAFIDVR
jgi:hypothetical protein